MKQCYWNLDDELAMKFHDMYVHQKDGFDFPDYTPEELIQIGRLILEEQQYKMTADAEAALLEYVEKRSQLPLFANARTISNAIDTARMRHANRMFNSGDAILTKADLVTITVDDIRESSLFSELEA